MKTDQVTRKQAETMRHVLRDAAIHGKSNKKDQTLTLTVSVGALNLVNFLLSQIEQDKDETAQV